MADFARSDDPAVQAQLDRLSLLSPGGDRLGLDRITRLLDRLGRPQDAACRPSSMSPEPTGRARPAHSSAQRSRHPGARVHMFTSPHLVRFNERIRIAGKLIENEALADLLPEVLDAGGDIEPASSRSRRPSPSSRLRKSRPMQPLIEVGLGGRLDATNVIERPLVTRDRGARDRPPAVPRCEPGRDRR